MKVLHTVSAQCTFLSEVRNKKVFPGILFANLQHSNMGSVCRGESNAALECQSPVHVCIPSYDCMFSTLP